MPAGRRGAVALVCLAALAGAAVHAEDRGIAATRQAARRAFKAKHYAVACPLYEKLVALAPDDPPTRADLAFCLQRQGRKTEAVAANYQALALAARTDASSKSASKGASKSAPNGDEATRRHAYHNLSELGVSVDVPRKDRCAPLAAPPGCAKQLWACALESTSQGSHGGLTWTLLRMGASAGEAGFDDNERLSPPSEKRTDFIQRTPTIDVEVASLQESRNCDDCGGDEHLSCDVVVADACLGLVGFVCDSYTDGKDDESVYVDEEYLTPVP